jgi:hypothetical protein
MIGEKLFLGVQDSGGAGQNNIIMKYNLEPCKNELEIF